MKALRLARKKEEIRDADPRKAYGKVGRYLIQKGYDYELTVKVLNKVFVFLNFVRKKRIIIYNNTVKSLRIAASFLSYVRRR